MENKPGPSHKLDFPLERQPGIRPRSNSDELIKTRNNLKAHFEAFKENLKIFINDPESDQALVSKFKPFEDEDFEDIFSVFSVATNLQKMDIYKYFLLNLRGLKVNIIFHTVCNIN